MESKGMTESRGSWAAISVVHEFNIAMEIRRLTTHRVGFARTGITNIDLPFIQSSPCVLQKFTFRKKSTHYLGMVERTRGRNRICFPGAFF